MLNEIDFKANDYVIEDGISSLLLLEYAKRNGKVVNGPYINLLNQLQAKLLQQLKNSLPLEAAESVENLTERIFYILLDKAQNREPTSHNKGVENVLLEFSGESERVYQLLYSTISDFYEQTRRTIAHTLDQIPSLVGFYASEYCQEIDLMQCLKKYLHLTDQRFREELKFKGKFNTTILQESSPRGIDKQSRMINQVEWDLPFPRKRHQEYVHFSWTLEYLTFTIPIEKIHTNRDQMISSITRTLEVHDQSSRIINREPAPEGFYTEASAKTLLLENPDKYPGKYHFRLDTRMIASRIVGLMAWDKKHDQRNVKKLSGSMAANNISRYLRENHLKRYSAEIVEKALEKASDEVKKYNCAHVPWLSNNERARLSANLANSTISTR